ncbi:alpha-1,6-glucosidase domain-containing protein [uncultured Ilyobacter sp.]|uniref:alpha-1,6-glucosidase domain-containing protein n=1 Tax=uncultured Ilyobacter sp. TaxID=544433 RepID=UPI0029F4CB51|nr:alpha-1,6-glucosidase domain-containing protein [uncultured Ilyobacter sp.]
MEHKKNLLAFWLSEKIIACKFEKKSCEIEDYSSLRYFIYFNPTGKIVEINDEIVLDGKTQEIKLKDIGDFSDTGDILQFEPEDSTEEKSYKKRINKKYGLLKRENGKDKIGYFKKLTFDESVNESKIKKMIAGNLIIVVKINNKKFRTVILQKADIIDKYYYYDKELGVVFNSKSDFKLKLWAPTAIEVKLHVYKYSNRNTEISGSPFDMENKNGVWKLKGRSGWKNYFYLYEVKVFSRHEGNRIISKLVTDPYSVSLSTNGKFSQIVNLGDYNDRDITPYNWNNHCFIFEYDFDPMDINLYELHIRDFSVYDDSITDEQIRGKYVSFTLNNTKSMNHLKELANAGLKYVHLLPVNDFSTVPEENSFDLKNTTVRNVREYFKIYDTGKIPNLDEITIAAEEIINSDSTLDEIFNKLTTKYGCSGKYQQNLTQLIQENDKYNWGYDPFHYMVPDGSYATNPNGKIRIKEFREMIQSLHNIGLRVVIDVVFNHTLQEDPLEWIVPDYYYRIEGNDLKPHCGFEIATENKMVEKLVADAIYKWVKYYKIDGIRFDRMQAMTLNSILKAKSKLKTLDVKNDKVDGKNIYFYGEGFDETLMGIEKFRSANRSTLWSYPKEKIGIFNQYIRDDLRGKSEKDNGVFERDNFIVKNGFDPSHNWSLNKSDMVGYLYEDKKNSITKQFNCPQSVINYVTCHDNGTLWDYLIAKVGFDNKNSHDYPPGRTEIMLKMHNIYCGIITLSQGIPFFQAGVELLRSKSGDFNSYNSGEWFNKLSYPDNTADNNTFKGSNWGIGFMDMLEWTGMEGEREKQLWDERWKERLEKIPKPTNRQVLYSKNHFKEMLQIRNSTKLFRLRKIKDIQNRVHFPDNIDNDLFIMKIDGLNLKQDGYKILENEIEIKGVYIFINVSWTDDKWYECSDIVKLHPVHLRTTNTLMEEYYKQNNLTDDISKNDHFIKNYRLRSKVRIPPLSILVYIY